jgi:hypothetical protein
MRNGGIRFRLATCGILAGPGSRSAYPGYACFANLPGAVYPSSAIAGAGEPGSKT